MHDVNRSEGAPVPPNRSARPMHGVPQRCIDRLDELKRQGSTRSAQKQNPARRSNRCMVDAIQAATRADPNMSHDSIENGWERFLERLRRLWGSLRGGAGAAAGTA